MPHGFMRALEQSAAILTATVAVNDYVGFRVAPEPRHTQRIGDQFGLHVWLHRPAHDPLAEQVDDDARIDALLAYAHAA
jgi:hypothetical protein